MDARRWTRASTLLGTAVACLLAVGSACPAELQNSFEVQVYATGSGAGTVTAAAGRIACNASAGATTGDCIEHYANEAGQHLYTASPASGSIFVDWVAPGNGTNACADPAASVCEVMWTVGSPAILVLQPHFAVTGVAERALTVSLRSNTGGHDNALPDSVTSGDGQIRCDNYPDDADRCTAWYQLGTIVVLHASEVAHSLVGWSHCAPDPVTPQDCAVALTETRQVVAHFVRQWTMDVIGAGAGSGTVTSADPGISCVITAGVRSGVCFESFVNAPNGGRVWLTAIPAAGSAFVEFTASERGVPYSCQGACLIAVFDGATVTATFILDPGFDLAVSFAGTGTGTVTSSPAGINCANFSGGGSTACTAHYGGGTSVTLTAAPNGGGTFTGWSGGGCTGTAPCVVLMDQARSVTASFGSPTFLLTIRHGFSLTGHGTGFVTSAPTGVSCTFTTGQTAPGGTCAAVFPAGTLVTLTAGVALPSTFVTWLLAPGCASNPVCQVTMDQDRTVDVLISP